MNRYLSMFLVLLILPLGMFFHKPQAVYSEPIEEKGERTFYTISMVWYDIWKDQNGWLDKPFGARGINYPHANTLPEQWWKGKYQLVDVKVTPLTETNWISPEIYIRTDRALWEPYTSFAAQYVRYGPNNYSISNSSIQPDLENGKVTYTRIFDLVPEVMDLKEAVIVSPSIRQSIEELGFVIPDVYAEEIEGWRWYAPALIEWKGVPIDELPNLLVGKINPGVEGEANAGTKYTGRAQIINDSDQAFTNVPVGVWNNGWRAKAFLNGKEISTIDIGANETVLIDFEYTAQANKSTIKVVVDAPPLPETITETTKEDNVGEIDVFSKAPPAPPSSSVLTFYTIDQAGHKKLATPQVRPAGTAKWTDWVTATLRPPAPNPPMGTLTSWSITSATITYPKKHPNFVFGNPLPPQGTVQKAMSVNGHTATVGFEQNWGMDGARIYNQITERLMAANPKNYSITANYTISYTYQWQERRRSCSTNSEGKRTCSTYYVTRTGSGTTSGTATGNLLVNGTGVNSLAQ